MGRRGRSIKDNTSSIVGKTIEQKTKAYGSSELLVELNSIVSKFTREQCTIAKSTGEKQLGRRIHCCLSGALHVVLAVSKLWTRKDGAAWLKCRCRQVVWFGVVGAYKL
jgi:hypothetical protein